MPRLFAPLFAALLALSPLAAQAEDYTLDPLHSHVGFRVMHLGVSYFYGHFDTYEGQLTDDGERSLTITVDPDSVDSNHPDRDRHLRITDFFDTENHPTWSFVSTAVEDTEDGYEVTGDFTLHGVTEEIVVNVTKTGEATDPRFGHRVGYLCEFSINRSDYGMDWGVDEGLLGDRVDITLSLQFIENEEGDGEEDAGDAE